MKKYLLEFEMLGLPKTTNQLYAMSWRDRGKYVSDLHRDIYFVIGIKRPAKPLKKAALTLTRYSSSRPDTDGLVGSFKAVIDALRAAGIIEDDKFVNIAIPNYLWVKAKAKCGRITVKVEGA